MTTAYVYRWTHLPTGCWYIGSRTAKGCHPNDGYICSSKIVKPLVQHNPGQWARTILATGTAEQMRKLERDILVGCNAKKDVMSFNRNNADGMPSGGRKKGTVKKLPRQEIVRALEHSLQQPLLTVIYNNYLNVKKAGDQHLIKQYRRMFANKGLTYE